MQPPVRSLLGIRSESPSGSRLHGPVPLGGSLISTPAYPTLRPIGTPAPNASSTRSHFVPDSSLATKSNFPVHRSSLPFPLIRLRDVEIQQTP